MSKEISLEKIERCCQPKEIVKAVTVAATLALFIISALTVAGHLPASTAGWIAVGLGGGVSILALTSEGKKRKYLILLTALTSLSFIGVGLLGGLGVLSAQQVGWGVMGTFLAGAFCWGGVETHCGNPRRYN